MQNRTLVAGAPTGEIQREDCGFVRQSTNYWVDEPKRLPYNITNRKNGCKTNMAFATITSKGQTTIPKEVRAAANLKSGDRIHFTVLEDGTIIVRVKNRSIRDISFKPPGGKRVSIARMTR
jgi:antitoxin PrlF